jgi:sugar phosphate isomerase/epimerase
MITTDQFGFNAFWWEQLHTEEQIQSCVNFLAKTGFRYVEFKRDSFRQNDLAGQFKLAAKMASAAGLKVSDFVVLRELADGNPKGVADVIDTLAACHEAESPLMNCCFGAGTGPIAPPAEQWWMPPRPNHQDGWDHLVRALDRICSAAEKYNVTLAMEATVGGLVYDYYSLRELFSRFDHPRLCLTMDPSHLLLARNDIPYAIRRLGSKIRHVHLKDAVGRPGIFGLDMLFPALGAGAIDWQAFFKALDDISYQGALCGEYEQFKYLAQLHRNDPEFVARATYDDMTALYNLCYRNQ